VTPKIFGIQLNISLKLLQLETSNLVHSFVLGVGKAEWAQNNFSQHGCGLCHVTSKISGKRSNMSSKLFELGTS